MQVLKIRIIITDNRKVLSMDELSPTAKIMNSVPGNAGASKISYIWMNTQKNNVLAELNRRTLREVYGLESNYFESGDYHVIKVDNTNKKKLTHDELLKELEL